MRNIIILLSFLLAACGSIPKQHSNDVSPSLAKLIPSSVPPPNVEWRSFSDFAGLRDAFARREDFRKRCIASRPRKVLREKLEAQNFKGAAEVARNFLEQCPVAAEIHLLYAVALSNLGRPKATKVHTHWFIGLTDSAMSKGDGTSPETAFVTISVPEEYAILFRLGLKPTQQALIQAQTMVDAITAVSKTGEERTVYFNPKWHFIRLHHLVQEISE